MSQQSIGGQVREGTNLPLVSSYNRSVVLEAIRSAAALSRVELADLTGLTPATVTNIVRRLISDELVVEVGRGQSTGGKPRTLLELNRSARLAVGVLLDTDSIRYVVTDLSGSVVAQRRSAGAGTKSVEIVTADIAKSIKRLVRSPGVDAERIVGIGVAAPGPLHRRGDVILRPPNYALWEEDVVRERLQNELGYPVLVDNDANAAALGEWWLTDTGSVRSYVCVYMGDGIGAGIFLDGEVYRGATLNAGEIGHISVDPRGARCHCGNLGCLEMYSSPRGIVAEAHRYAEKHGREALGLSGPRAGVLADFRAIMNAAVSGVPYAEHLLQRSVDYLTVAVLGIVNTLDLELVVLTGHGFTGLDDRYLPAMREAMRERAFARDLQVCQVRMSRSVEDAGAVGAASLVMHSNFAPQPLGVRSSHTVEAPLR
jgi:predicted NBD/HSP70 family sugar kinase